MPNDVGPRSAGNLAATASRASAALGSWAIQAQGPQTLPCTKEKDGRGRFIEKDGRGTGGDGRGWFIEPQLRQGLAEITVFEGNCDDQHALFLLRRRNCFGPESQSAALAGP